MFGIENSPANLGRVRVPFLALCFFGSIASSMAGTKLLPVLNSPIADRSGLAGTPFTVNLNSAFGTEAIDDQVVRFTTLFSSGNSSIVLDMALFSNRTPVTRQNFLNYVNSGRYLYSIIHRSMPDFVIQGGGIILNNIVYDSGNKTYTYGLAYVATDPPIVNEFGVSNTLGTISMAKNDGDPNSATSQWFVSLGANSNNLDSQNGGFTVFGRITKATLSNAQIFGDQNVFPVSNYGAPLDNLPLFYTYDSKSSPQPQPTDFILFTNVSLVPLPSGQAGEDPTLTYSVVSSNESVATASSQPNGQLSLSPVAGQTGSTVITVRATDTVGNTVDNSFTLNVNQADTFTTWASRNTFSGGQSSSSQDPDRDGWNNLQEFAFMGDPSAPDPTGLAVFPGIAGTAPTKYLTLTFPVRKFTQGLTYIVEGNDGLSGAWTEIWNSTNGFSHAQVVSAVDKTDRTVVTIKDTSVIGAQPRRFLRARVVQQ